MKKRVLSILLSALLLLSFAGCSSKSGNDLNAENADAIENIFQNVAGDLYFSVGDEGAVADKELAEGVEGDLVEVHTSAQTPSFTPDIDETKPLFKENQFINVSEQDVSTFSADVDTASYAFFRKLVSQGYSLSELISTAGASIRTEEMVNYFDYSCPGPNDGELFGVKFAAAPCPWNKSALLMTATLATEPTVEKSKNNLVFLVDTSGSMYSSDKLDLLKKSFSYLVSNLGDDDVISIVTYAGDSRVVLDGCSGAKKDKILNAINSLESGGSTNGEAGMKKAYEIAEAHFLSDGNNRIIMASDGDLNVGISSVSEIEKFVSEKRGENVYLSLLGFGTGNYKDATMETIADKGNGVYYYIDGEYEAEKIFGNDLFSTLYPVASDVKLQLTFNKDAVKSYRLVGYENRLLNEEDFKDDTKDAGELGAGHAVTVCYELILTDSAKAAGTKWADLAVRHKPIGQTKSVESNYTLTSDVYTETPDDEFKFICAVIETSMLLHRSEHSEIGMEQIISELSKLNLDEEKEQFLTLLKQLPDR